MAAVGAGSRARLNNFLKKPFTPAALKGKIERIFGPLA